VSGGIFGGSMIARSRGTEAAGSEQLDNASLAATFSGRLLLVYGDMDENALPAVTLQVADALEKANKSFDLLYLPNRTHSFFRNDPNYSRYRGRSPK
jgi:dipeptidyl-peptidase-4